MEAAVAATLSASCLLSIITGEKGRDEGDFPSHSTLHHKYQGQEGKKAMFLTEALPPIADVDEETESSNSCVFGDVSLQTNHNMKIRAR